MLIQLEWKRVARFAVAALVLGGCSSSSRDDFERTPRDTTVPIPEAMTCFASEVPATSGQTGLEVQAQFGVPPYNVSNLTYDTNPTGEDILTFEAGDPAFNSRQTFQVTGIPAGTESVFGDVEITDATGKVGSCSFRLELGEGGGSGSGSPMDGCYLYFSHNPTPTNQLVYVAAVSTDPPGWFWLHNITSSPGFLYGGAPDGVTGHVGYLSGGIFELVAEVEDPTTGEKGTCTGTQWVLGW